MAGALDVEAILFGDREARGRFFAESLNRRWVKLRAPGALGDLFSLEQLAAHAFTPLAPGKGGDLISFRAAFYDQQGRGRAFGGPLEMARQLLDAGMTLSFDGLQRLDPRLEALAAGFARLAAIVEPIVINCFLSPEGSGFPWHFDATHVLVLQISGEKRWLLGPQVELPPFHLQGDAPSTPATETVLRELGYSFPKAESAPAEEVLVQPNDVLYLPPGTWHRAFARGSSTHLSLVIKPFGFARVLRAALTATALVRSDWRLDAQRVGVDDESPPPSARPELLRFFADRLEEARRELAKMTPQRLVRTMEVLAGSPVGREILLGLCTKDVL
jgi:ribosomal protein L16 Arg81 hydroxylase